MMLELFMNFLHTFIKTLRVSKNSKPSLIMSKKTLETTIHKSCKTKFRNDLVGYLDPHSSPILVQEFI